jgi:predicted Ser/Thr protein kinase
MKALDILNVLYFEAALARYKFDVTNFIIKALESRNSADISFSCNPKFSEILREFIHSNLFMQTTDGHMPEVFFIKMVADEKDWEESKRSGYFKRQVEYAEYVADILKG